MTCNRETEVYSRVVGYYRPVQQWNTAKQAEFAARKLYGSLSLTKAPHTNDNSVSVEQTIHKSFANVGELTGYGITDPNQHDG